MAELVHSTKWSTLLGHDTWVRKVQVDEDVGKLLVIKKKKSLMLTFKRKMFQPALVILFGRSHKKR